MYTSAEQKEHYVNDEPLSYVAICTWYIFYAYLREYKLTINSVRNTKCQVKNLQNVGDPYQQ